MQSLARLMTGAAAAALVISSLATPVAAASTPAKVVLVHGIPGATVEVCVSGREVRKQFRYGHHMRASLAPGTYQLAIRRAARGDCAGDLVAKKRVVLADGGRLTIVASFRRSGPALLVFDDREVLERVDRAAIATYGVVQHAARLGPLDFYVAAPLSTAVSGPMPTVPRMLKGTQQGGPTEPGALVLWLNRAGSPKPVIGPALVQMRDGKLNHLVAVGTHRFNARFVFFSTRLES